MCVHNRGSCKNGASIKNTSLCAGELGWYMTLCDQVALGESVNQVSELFPGFGLR